MKKKCKTNDSGCEKKLGLVKGKKPGIVTKKKLLTSMQKNKMTLDSTTKDSEMCSQHNETTARNLKRANKCYRCGNDGHCISSCPQLDDSEKIVVCFSCGSSEHISKECPNPNKDIPFAKCLACKKTGHLHFDCPEVKAKSTKYTTMLPRHDYSTLTKKNTCFSCRQEGHKLNQCPNIKESEKVTICYLCGSTEHISKKCKIRNQGCAPFATCFVCQEKGHLSSHCPLNTSGIYVNGGSCNGCGSKQHLYSNCPKRKESKGKTESEQEVVAFKQTNTESADSIVISEKHEPQAFRRHPPYVVFHTFLR